MVLLIVLFSKNKCIIDYQLNSAIGILCPHPNEGHVAKI